MNDKEVKSFDTVDLLAPMDLIPIQGIESPALKVETYKSNRNSSRRYRNLNVNPMMIFLDEEIEGIKRNSLNREKTKKKIFVILIFVLIIILIAAIRSQIP